LKEKETFAHLPTLVKKLKPVRLQTTRKSALKTVLENPD
jgi:hypothetical protein